MGPQVYSLEDLTSCCFSTLWTSCVSPLQVIQAPEQVITLAESELAGSQVFLTLPGSQGHPSDRAELVTVTMEDLLNEKVTLICQEAK